ncbi:MAG TPA: hypothetical protein VMT30_07795 [Candidatus Saccharimonadia bacterium]|nr:hypothetical protein [Candidatus Saccharimonadia bacterium]
MKTVVIFCRTVDPHGYPFNEPYYWESYLDLMFAIRKRGAQAYFATDNATYLGDGLFSTAYTTDTKRPADEFEVVHNVKADVVYEKGGFTGKDVLVINPAFVHDITSSKTETYKYFGKYQPKTVIAHDRSELERAAEELAGDMIVVKEPEGNGGKAVFIGPRAEVLAKMPATYPLIVQEFVDTSVGIEGLVEGMHDLRIKIGGGKIWGAKIRMPAPGEYRANVSQGGSERYLYTEQIPADVAALALEIDQFFADYPRYYALDFANTPQGWKLIELNSKPGLTPVSQSAPTRHIIEMLADYLIEVAPS